MAEVAPPKIEITSREAILAVGFVFLIIIAIALVQAGIITNPISLGLMITITIALILVGHFLVRAGIISRSAVPLWYIMVFGLVMLLYGGVATGYLPAIAIPHASVTEIAITTSLFYALVAVAVGAALAVLYFGYKYWWKRREESIAV